MGREEQRNAECLPGLFSFRRQPESVLCHRQTQSHLPASLKFETAWEGVGAFSSCLSLSPYTSRGLGERGDIGMDALNAKFESLLLLSHVNKQGKKGRKPVTPREQWRRVRMPERQEASLPSFLLPCLLHLLHSAFPACPSRRNV